LCRAGKEGGVSVRSGGWSSVLVAKGEASSVCGWAAYSVALVMATRGLFV
jgi:hypothetical protein